MLVLGFTSEGDPLGKIEADTEEAARAEFKVRNGDRFVYVVEEQKYNARLVEMEAEFQGRADALCHHEAAHAVIGLAVGLGIARISMRPRPFNTGNGFTNMPKGHSLALTCIEPASWPKHQVLFAWAKSVMIQAGWAAERKLDHKPDWERFKTEGGSDAARAVELWLVLAHYTDQKIINAVMTWTTGYTDGIVAEHWPAIERLAALLKRKWGVPGGEETTGEEFEAFIRSIDLRPTKYRDHVKLIEQLNRLKREREVRERAGIPAPQASPEDQVS